jgi:dephospho-CoA kinase
MKNLVLGITGKRGSGKDTVANHLKKKYKFRVLVYTDDLLGPMLKVEGKDVTRDNLIKLATELRKEYGPAVLTKMLCERIKTDGLWCISGVRLPEEAQYMKINYPGNARLMKVECDNKKRFARIRSRGTKGERSITYKQFLDVEKKPTETPIEKTMKLADFSVDNNGSEKSLQTQIDRIMKGLLKDEK